MKYRQHFGSTIVAIRREGCASSRIWDLKRWSFTSLSDALISLIPIYGPWIIFGIVALEVPACLCVCRRAGVKHSC
jgi:hypothetical protein